jgi:hypothetical protein
MQVERINVLRRVQISLSATVLESLRTALSMVALTWGFVDRQPKLFFVCHSEVIRILAKSDAGWAIEG